MNRTLMITINEAAGGLRRRSSGQARRRSGADPETEYVLPPPDDPETEYVLPPPDDPETEYVLPPPDDPETEYVLPPPDDPSGGAYSYGQPPGGPGAPPWGPAVGTVHAWSGPAPGACCCCPPAEATTTAPARPGLAPGGYSGFVIVRLRQGVRSLKATDLWSLAGELGLTALKAVLELPVEKAEAPAPAAQAPQGPAPRPPADPAVKPPAGGTAGPAVEPVAGPPAGSLVSRPLVELKGRRVRELTLSDLWALEARAAGSPFRPLHSLTAYWRLDLRPYPDRAEEVVGKLKRLAEVDLAYRELAATDPQLTAAAPGGQAFAEDQGYLEDAPTGIGAAWAWQRLAGTTAQLTLCDLEQHWRPDHQDLDTKVEKALAYGANRAVDEGSPGHHGTAVLGQLAAAGGNLHGVQGAAADLGRFLLTSHYRSKGEKEGLPPAQTPHPFAGTNGHVAAAIANALVAPPAGDPLAGKGLVPLEAGDVLLLEVQRGLLPTEIDAADLDAIRLASALGVIVVEAAGNGGFDLDRYLDPDTGVALRRGDSRSRDSGAILVGAARAAVPHDRAPFSNHGSRLDCFGWGEAVTSCGYGDLAGSQETELYTNSFCGTSSAAPIIAGAAALVQALHEVGTGRRLEPRAMRAVLSDPSTGTRQGPGVGGHIGVMPDLKALVARRLQLVPDLYLRRHVGDDGGAPRAGGELSSSPDILLWAGKPADAPARFGEGPEANAPAPGTALDPQAPNKILATRLYLRLRNRGGGAGTASVRLFASPAATLITPERWAPMGSVEVKDVREGDLLKVSAAHDWAASLTASILAAGGQPKPPAQPLSFLAVIKPEGAAANPFGFDATSALPPGPPYFDWARFRAFLSGPGVAWRNVHAIAVGGQTSAAPLKLEFLISGTPDHARHFDFEVIPRLPADAAVKLVVPPAFAAKLRQRQPFLDAGAGDLVLPRRSRTRLCGVKLAPGVHVAARFEVTATPPSALAEGHSLAIRQLWRGEEVGRITWWFVGGGGGTVPLDLGAPTNPT
jgi:hypothetical protein